MPRCHKKQIRMAKTINRWARGARSRVEELIREWHVGNILECVVVQREWREPGAYFIDESCEARVYDKVARDRENSWITKLIHQGGPFHTKNNMVYPKDLLESVLKEGIPKEKLIAMTGLIEHTPRNHHMEILRTIEMQKNRGMEIVTFDLGKDGRAHARGYMNASEPKA